MRYVYPLLMILRSGKALAEQTFRSELIVMPKGDSPQDQPPQESAVNAETIQMPPEDKDPGSEPEELAPVPDAVMFAPPPPFRGAPGDDFNDWIKRFNRWALCCHHNKLRKCEILPVLLEGRAAHVYDAVPAIIRANFDALTDLLSERLQPPQLSDLKSVELHTREQRPGEPITDYARDIQTLTRQAYPKIDATAQDQIMKRIFLNGLLPAFRTFAMLSDPASFDKAVTAARRQEAQQQFNDVRNGLSEKQTAEITNKILTRLGKLDLAPEDRNPHFSPRAPGRRNFIRRPSYQHPSRPFHQRTQLPRFEGQPQAPRQPSSQPQRLRWTQRGEPICWHCHRPGHRQSQCPEAIPARNPPNPTTRRAMAVRETEMSEIENIRKENEVLRLQNERLSEQLYPKRIAAIIRIPIPQRSHGKLLLLLINILLLCASTYAYTFFSCGASSHGFALAVPKEVRCIPPSVGSVTQHVVELWVPRTDPVKVPAMKCQIHIRTVCTHIGFFGSKGIVSDTKDIRTVQVNDCRAVAINKRWNNKELTQLSPRLWASKDDFEVKFKWCCRDNCFEHQTFILQYGEIASMDSEHVLSDLGDLGGCHAKSGVCYNLEAAILWDSTAFLSSTCPYVLKAQYTAEIGEHYIIIDEIQGAFSLNESKPVPACIPAYSSMTDQGVIIRVETSDIITPNQSELQRNIRQVNLESNEVAINSSQPTQKSIVRLPTTTASKFIRQITENTPPPDLDPVNAKLFYLETRLLQMEQNNFRKVWNALCHVASRQLHLINQFLRIDPTLGARTLLGRDDIHATFAGEALMIWQCVAITPDEIYWDYRVNNTCFTYVPVIANETMYFLIPGSNDLVLQAPKIPCEHHFAGIYFNGKEWMTTNGKIQVTSIPMDLAFKGQWKSFSFNSPALFHSKLAGLANELEFLRSYSSRIQDLQIQMDRVINYTAELSLDPKVISAALRGVGDGIGNIIVAEGTAVGNIFQGVGRGAGQLLDGVLKGPIQVIVNTLVFLLILLIIGFIIYKFGGPRLMQLFNRTNENEAQVEDPAPEEIPMVRIRRNRREAQRFVFHLGHSSASIIDIQINNMKTQALWDTGADITLISSDLFEQLRKTQNVTCIKCERPNIQTVNGHNITLQWAAPLTFTVGQHKQEHTTWTVPTMTPDCIIGTDLQSKFGPFTIDHKKRTLKIHHDDQILTQSPSDTEPVQLCLNTIIPARTECIVLGATKLNHSAEFEPDDLLHERYHVQCAYTLVTPVDGKIPVRLLNTTNSHIELYAGMKLGLLYKDQFVAPVKTVNNSLQNTSRARDLINLDQAEINNTERKALLTLLDDYDDIFAKHDYDIGHTDMIKHSIELTDNKPIYQRPYRIPASRKEFVEKTINEMLEHGIITPSKSPWASPIVIVPKKNGKFRFAVDYRKLNAITKRDVFPLPRIDDILDSLGKAQFFSTLDMCAGYWQVPVEPQDREKTAFISHTGLFEFTVMPFGLTNAPATFQRMVNLLLSGLNWKSSIAYLDDIIVFSHTFEQHLSHLSEIFERFRKQNLKLSPNKCQFFRREVPFLGHIVDKQGVRPDPSKTEAVANYPTPKNISEIRSFLGLASYYRRFIPNFAKISFPLVLLLKKNQPFIWNEEQTKAFNQLRQVLCEAPILTYPDFTKEFILHTDASGFAVGAVLSQIHNGNENPIAYASRTLRPAEKNYSTIEKECLAFIFAIKHFHCYLYGRKFKLITDHAPLRWLMNTKEQTGRLARWSLALQQHDFEICHRPGTAHKNADALSRIVAVAALNTYSWYKSAITEEQFKNLQQNDPELNALIQYLYKHKLPEEEGEARQIIHQSEQFLLHQDILYHIPNISNRQRFRVPQLVVPKDLRTDMLKLCHENVTAGHFGPSKTLTKVLSYYYWPTVHKDVFNFCRSCVKCQQRKRPARYNKEPLVNLPISQTPFEMVAVDVLGPLPQTYEGNRYIIVFMDYFTKWPEATATSDQKADTTARTFIHDIISRHGCPLKLLSDRGTNFMSHLIQSTCATLGVKKIETSPYHPQTDGMVEKFNSTLLQILSMYCEKNQRDWDIYLPLALFAYRTSINETTEESPFYLLYGRDPVLPANLKYPIPTTYADERNYKDIITERLQDAWNITRIKIERAQKHQKDNYDKSAITTDYHVGDKVLVYTPRPKKGQSPKLTHHWLGPFRIVEVNTPTVKIIPIDQPKSTAQVVHKNRLKSFLGPFLSGEMSDFKVDEDTVSITESEVENLEEIAQQLSDNPATEPNNSPTEEELRRRCLQDQPTVILPKIVVKDTNRAAVQAKYNLRQRH